MAVLSLSLGNILVLAVGSVVTYTVGSLFYNVFLHPLRRFPGPFWWRATWIGQSIYSYRGTLPFKMLDLHRKYGTIVRISPNQLAFADPAAWKDIMGHRTHGEPEMEKWDAFYRPIEHAPREIVTAKKEEHAQLRRTLAHGFSEKSMRDQQPIIKQYVDLLIKRLGEHSQGGKPVDISGWYNFTTFDVIGDLAFGESFGCLDKSDYHPWVKLIFKMARVGTILQIASHFPMMKLLVLLSLRMVLPKGAGEEREQHEELTMRKLMKRMEAGYERPDLIEGLLKRKDEWGLTLEKLRANASLLIIGGSETTATLLSGVTFLLLTNPGPMRKLAEEIRSAFQSEEEINFTTVSNLPYLLACLDEALRMYPPVPIGLPRVVPKGGAVICGEHVPAGTIVGVWQWALYHNEKYFKDPFEFHPERWMGDSKYASDCKEAFQPFHIGTRNCIGRNLAYIEMRIIMARVLWNYDMKISDDSLNWMTRQKIFNLWEKGELFAYLTPAAR